MLSKRVKLVLFLSIFSMSSLYVSSLIVSGAASDGVEEIIHNKKGDKVAFLKDYSYIDTWGIRNIIPSWYKVETKAKFSGKDSKFVSEVLEYYSKYTYNETQSDPNLLWELGGNCQAISLNLYNEFSSNGLETGFIYEDNYEHVYNWVKLEDGTLYEIDLVKGVIRSD